jgi:hypothetical protein
MICETIRRPSSNPVFSMSSESGADLHKYGGVAGFGPVRGQSALERIGYLPFRPGKRRCGTGTSSCPNLHVSTLTGAL